MSSHYRSSRSGGLSTYFSGSSSRIYGPPHRSSSRTHGLTFRSTNSTSILSTSHRNSPSSPLYHHHHRHSDHQQEHRHSDHHHHHRSRSTLEPTSSRRPYSNDHRLEEKQRLQSKSTIDSQSKHSYPRFHMISNDYETVLINDTTSTNSLNQLLDHVHECLQYSIDTESDCRNNVLSVIQVN